MRRVKHTLRGSTLAETLVMMLVAGIVFLAAMEALTLVSRLVARRAAVLVEEGEEARGGSVGSTTESPASGSCSQRPTASAAQRAEAQASCCTSIVQEARRH